MSSVPATVLRELSKGSVETVNLMEWLAADMGKLAQAVARETSDLTLKAALKKAAVVAKHLGVVARMRAFGSAIASSSNLDGSHFRRLAEHRSDLVRQWACYAVNDPFLNMAIGDRLERTLPFATDTNMSVREAAWMAFRPHLEASFNDALRRLEVVAAHANPNCRRFAVEVTRPRSVWGGHLRRLKVEPQLAEPLLENVRNDASRYVQLAAGNWINDAAKTRPDWALRLCERWMQNPDPATHKIVVRGLRTLRSQRSGESAKLFPITWPAALEIV